MQKFNEDIHNLKLVLERQHTCLEEMLSVLKYEHLSLTSNNLDNFEDAVQQKRQQVKRLEEIQPALASIERTIGGVLSKSTFNAFIQRMPHSEEKNDIESVWTDFQETLKQCNTQNKTNNRILSASSINVKQALNILRGNTNDAPGIYSQTGQQRDNMQGKSLAIA